MKQFRDTRQIESFKQQSLFPTAREQPANKSISVYRVCLVKDASISFGSVRLNNSQQAQALIQKLILTKGQPDREQFVVALLNSKNEFIGVNIVAVGTLSLHFPRAVTARKTVTSLFHTSQPFGHSDHRHSVAVRSDSLILLAE